MRSIFQSFGVFHGKSIDEIPQTKEKLEKDLQEGICHGILALGNGEEALGCVLYSYSYSAFKGRILYFSGLFVKEAHRDHGVGMALIHALYKVSKSTCTESLLRQELASSSY